MKKPFIVAIIVFSVLAGVIVASLPNAPQHPASASQESEQCQYPNRSTNQPGACDNSDPCDPADAAKGGSGACAQTGTQEKQEEATGHSEAVQQPVPVTNKCNN